MPTLENDKLVFRFPQIESEASFSIEFQRTLRIPDSDKTYPLPPGLGRFPVRHAEDYSERQPASTASRGGVILPIWQAEAMWLNFRNEGPGWDLPFPIAIKIAAGKINAVTGETWRSGLHHDPQDYMVSPEQPWLDGYAVEKGIIRQFVAMPLGEGYSVEEQLTGQAEWGGIQISVAPLKTHVWLKKRQEWERRQRERMAQFDSPHDRTFDCLSVPHSMGLAAGGRMRQSIYPDPFDVADWNQDAIDRVFVTLVHAKDWKSVTGEAAPNEPPSAKDYSAAGLPWFDYYGNGQNARAGALKLVGIKSLAKLFKQKTGASMPNSQDVNTTNLKALGPGSRPPRPVRSLETWE